MSTSAIEKGPNRSSGGGLVRLGTDVAGTIYHESDVAGAGKYERDALEVVPWATMRRVVERADRIWIAGNEEHVVRTIGVEAAPYAPKVL